MHHSGVRRVPHNERSSDGDRSSPRRFSNPGLYTGLFALLMALVLIGMPTRVEGKRGARIPDDLSDVTDHEEDASWREWGEGIKEHPKIRPLDPERKEDQDFKTMAMCVVTLSVPVMKERGRKLDGCVGLVISPRLPTSCCARNAAPGRRVACVPSPARCSDGCRTLVLSRNRALLSNSLHGSFKHPPHPYTGGNDGTGSRTRGRNSWHRAGCKAAT